MSDTPTPDDKFPCDPRAGISPPVEYSITWNDPDPTRHIRTQVTPDPTAPEQVETLVSLLRHNSEWEGLEDIDREAHDQAIAALLALSAKLAEAKAHAREMEGSAQAALAGYEAEREARQAAEAERDALDAAWSERVALLEKAICGLQAGRDTIAAHAEPIKGTPYSCGPRAWCEVFDRATRQKWGEG